MALSSPHADTSFQPQHQFGGFSAESLADRIIDARSNVLVTADGTFRGSKFVALKHIADEALNKCKARGFEVQHCIVSSNLGDRAPNPIQMEAGRDKYFHDLENSGMLPVIVELFGDATQDLSS